MRLRLWIERAVALTIGMFMVGYVFIYVAWVKEDLHKTDCVKRRVTSIDNIFKPSLDSAAKFQQGKHLVRTLRGQEMKASSEVPNFNVSHEHGELHKTNESLPTELPKHNASLRLRGEQNTTTTIDKEQKPNIVQRTYLDNGTQHLEINTTLTQLQVQLQHQQNKENFSKTTTPPTKLLIPPKNDTEQKYVPQKGEAVVKSPPVKPVIKPKKSATQEPKLHQKPTVSSNKSIAKRDTPPKKQKSLKSSVQPKVIQANQGKPLEEHKVQKPSKRHPEKAGANSLQKQQKSNSSEPVQKTEGKTVNSASNPGRQKQKPPQNKQKSSQNKPKQPVPQQPSNKVTQKPKPKAPLPNTAPKSEGKAHNQSQQSAAISDPAPKHAKSEGKAHKQPPQKAPQSNTAPKSDGKAPKPPQKKVPKSNGAPKSQGNVPQNKTQPKPGNKQQQQHIQKRGAKAQPRNSVQKPVPLFPDVPTLNRTRNYLYDMVIVTIVSSSYLDFTTNWLIAMERLGGKSPKIYIIAEDQETYDFFHKKHNLEEKISTRMSKILEYVIVLKSPHVNSKSKQLLDTEVYRHFMKPHYVLDILNRGYDVLYCDVDAIWFQRPYQQLSKKDSDIYIAQSQGQPEPSIVYPGFAMYRPTNATKLFLERWVAEVDSIKGEKSDVDVFNKLIKNETVIQKPVPKVKLKILDLDKVVPADYYFNDTWRKQHPDVNLITLLLNRISFRYSKVQRLVEVKKWFISRY